MKKRTSKRAYDILVERFNLKRATIHRRIQRNDLVMIIALKEAIEQVKNEVEKANLIKEELYERKESI